MAIEIYTGKPGNGKTAFLVERLMKEAEKGERPIFAAGINGLAPGLATVLEDPRKWAEIIDYEQGPCTCPLVGGEMVDAASGSYKPHTHRIPSGALVFIDEAWKWFGHLHDASRQATPKHVLDLAEHRHMGIDFVWTTQGPNQLYPFVRPLIANHTHCVRRYNTHFVDTFTWEELQEDVKSSGRRESSQRATKTLPKSAFGNYKSAQAHTMKRNIPWRVVALPGLLLAVVLAGWAAYAKLRPSAMTDSTAAEGASASLLAPPPATASRSSGGEERQPLTPTEYATHHLPRFATMPWTAPVFDHRQVTVDPRLFCMASGPGMRSNGEWSDGGCHCVTEQGTRYDIGEGECRRVARWGTPYNPYRGAGEREDRREGYALAPEQRSYLQRSRELAPFSGGIAGSAPRPMVAPEFGTVTRPQP